MKATWLVTPHFLDTVEPAVAQAAPTTAAVNGPFSVPDRSAASLAEIHRPIQRFVHEAASAGDLPISVAGDCVACIPVTAGLQAAGLAPALVWLDAHGDFNTPETSPSQFLGGMPLAMMVGRGPQDFVDSVGLRPIAESDVWLVDARDLDPLEQAAVEASAVNHISLSQLAELSIDRPVHVHFDNDIIDAAEAPANHYPAPNGPQSAEIIAACHQFVSGNNIVAISFTGWDGSHESADISRDICARLLDELVRAIVPNE